MQHKNNNYRIFHNIVLMDSEGMFTSSLGRRETDGRRNNPSVFNRHGIIRLRALPKIKAVGITLPLIPRQNRAPKK